MSVELGPIYESQLGFVRFQIVRVKVDQLVEGLLGLIHVLDEAANEVGFLILASNEAHEGI